MAKNPKDTDWIGYVTYLKAPISAARGAIVALPLAGCYLPQIIPPWPNSSHSLTFAIGILVCIFVYPILDHYQDGGKISKIRKRSAWAGIGCLAVFVIFHSLFVEETEKYGIVVKGWSLTQDALDYCESEGIDPKDTSGIIDDYTDRDHARMWSGLGLIRWGIFVSFALMFSCFLVSISTLVYDRYRNALLNAPIEAGSE